MSYPAIHKDRVISMLLERKSPREIMTATGCSRSTVDKYRIELDLPPFSKGGDPRKSA